MGGMKIAGDRTQQGVQEIMKREGLDEDDALRMIIDLGLKDYVVEL